MAYTLSGLAALGALGAPATSSGLGDQYSVVAYATGTEKRKAEISPHMNAMGLRVMSWPNPGRVGDEWRYTGKVLTTVAMNATAVKAAVITALVRSGADPRTVTVTLLTWPIEGSGGSGGAIATSDACRARGGVCRDINAQPVRANEEVIRGLCTGPSNIVCVIPRRASTGGGGGGSSGGGTPSPVSPVVDRGGSFDIGKAVLIGGASLFALALIITLVKKKRASSSMRAAAAATPVRVLPSPRAANRRRNGGSVEKRIADAARVAAVFAKSSQADDVFVPVSELGSPTFVKRHLREIAAMAGLSSPKYLPSKFHKSGAGAFGRYGGGLKSRYDVAEVWFKRV